METTTSNNENAQLPLTPDQVLRIEAAKLIAIHSNQLIGHSIPHDLSLKDFESLFDLLHDRIENQYDEYAPTLEVQSFLDIMKRMKLQFRKCF